MLYYKSPVYKAGDLFYQKYRAVPVVPHPLRMNISDREILAAVSGIQINTAPRILIGIERYGFAGCKPASETDTAGHTKVFAGRLVILRYYGTASCKHG